MATMNKTIRYCQHQNLIDNINNIKNTFSCNLYEACKMLDVRVRRYYTAVDYISKNPIQMGGNELIANIPSKKKAIDNLNIVLTTTEKNNSMFVKSSIKNSDSKKQEDEKNRKKFERRRNNLERVKNINLCLDKNENIDQHKEKNKTSRDRAKNLFDKLNKISPN